LHGSTCLLARAASQPERRLGRLRTGAVADGASLRSHRPLPAPLAGSLFAPFIGVERIDPDTVHERPIGGHCWIAGKFVSAKPTG
jgi:hypothetical protein